MAPPKAYQKRAAAARNAKKMKAEVLRKLYHPTSTAIARKTPVRTRLRLVQPTPPKPNQGGQNKGLRTVPYSKYTNPNEVILLL